MVLWIISHLMALIFTSLASAEMIRRLLANEDGWAWFALQSIGGILLLVYIEKVKIK